LKLDFGKLEFYELNIIEIEFHVLYAKVELADVAFRLKKTT